MNIVPPDQTPSNQGSVARGCLMGCAVQIVCFLLGFAVASFVNGKWGAIAFLSWGVTQWIIIVPLIRDVDAEGQTRTKQGLLIAGSLGVLLSAACGSMVIGSWR